MKKILIVTHWFYPVNVPRAFRATELAKQLHKDGYDVTVNVIRDGKTFNMRDYEEQKKNLQSYSFGSKKSSILLNKLNQIFEYFFGERFLYTSKKQFKDIDISKYDVVISIGLPFYIHRLTSSLIKKNRDWRGISIADWSDPYFDSHVKLAPYFKNIQKNALETFDYNVIPIENALSYYTNFVEENKIKIIPQGFDIKNTKLSNLHNDEIVKFAYAGQFYIDIRNPEKLLKYLLSVKIDFEFHIYTILRGPIYENVLLKYKHLMPDKIIIHEVIDRKDLLYELSKMDFLINLQNTTSNQTPSKLIDYAITKRPILNLSDEFSSILDFLDKDYSNSLNINIEDYDIENVAKKFENLF